MIRITYITGLQSLLMLIMSLVFFAAMPVAAANIYVDDGCSLGNAIEAANKDQGEEDCESGHGHDTIFFTRDISREDSATKIRTEITIDGRGFSLVMEEPEGAIDVDEGDLTVRNLRVVYKKRRENEVFNVEDGKLTLIDTTATNCTEGVDQEGSVTIIRGNSNLCGLPPDEMVVGDYKATVDVTTAPGPQEPGTCASLPAGVATVSATYGLASGVQCTQVGADGIGVQSVIDAGFIEAVDLWGYVEQGVEICFPQLGSVTFLDTATTPRVVATAESYDKNGNTCTMLTRAGIVVLVPGAPTGVAPPDTAQPATGTGADSTSGGCPIHTTGHLLLRATPSLQGEILGYVPRGSNLISPSRATYWYQVNYQGQAGWIGHKYVRANC